MDADTPDQGRCPFAHGSEGVVAQLDPFGAPYMSDPYAVFARARKEGRVFYSEELGHWILTRYEDIKAVLRDTKRYSADIANQPLVPFSDEVREELSRAGFRPKRVLVDNDPPNHLRIRRHVNKAFNARRLRLLAPDIRELAQQHIDAFADQDEIDFVTALAWPLPALVIFRLFGVAADRLDIIKHGSRDRVTLTDARPTPQEQRRAAEGLGAFFAYCREIVADRMNNLVDDFPSDLIRSGQGDETAPDFDELVTIMYSILFAGHETTTGFLTHLVRRCLEQPGLWDRLREDRGLVPAMVEEALRLDPPVINWRRRAKEDVLIGDTVIPADASLLLLLGSANHDESVYDHPDDVDLARDAAQPHLAFGAGPHMCLGAPLARLEGEIVLEALLDRFPHPSLPEQKLGFHPNLRFRNSERLLVRLHATS